jgi:nucleoside-triphosphatase
VARLLLTGPPGAGKTTLATKVIGELRQRGEALAGFTTAEVRRGGRRTGFVVVGMGGLERTLAVRGGPGPRVGAYGVDLAAFEEVALLELESGLELGSTIVVDEIGKMELLSGRFRDIVSDVFESPRVLATVGVHRDPLLDDLRKRSDVLVFSVQRAASGPSVGHLADLVCDVPTAAAEG